jgi:hypothetical protein
VEIRSRLMKRLDGTAQSIQGFEMGKNWWVWRASREKLGRERGKREVENINGNSQNTGSWLEG